MVGGHKSFAFNPCVFGVNILVETDRVTPRDSCSNPGLILCFGGYVAEGLGFWQRCRMGMGWQQQCAGVVCTKVFVLPGWIVQEPRLGIAYCGKMELQ